MTLKMAPFKQLFPNLTQICPWPTLSHMTTPDCKRDWNYGVLAGHIVAPKNVEFRKEEGRNEYLLDHHNR